MLVKCLLTRLKSKPKFSPNHCKGLYSHVLPHDIESVLSNWLLSQVLHQITFSSFTLKCKISRFCNNSKTLTQHVKTTTSLNTHLYWFGLHVVKTYYLYIKLSPSSYTVACCISAVNMQYIALTFSGIINIWRTYGYNGKLYLFEYWFFNTLISRQNDRHFADDIFQPHFLEWGYMNSDWNFIEVCS